MNDCHRPLQVAVSHGDEHAFAQLFHRFYARLLAFAHTIVHSKELAEEVVEDVFIKLWRNRTQLAEVTNLQVYLYVATKNTALNTLSSKANQLITEPFDTLDFEISAPASSPYELMITNEMHEKMKQAIDDLPPRCKMIFKLVREDGLKYKEVATILNISVNTIDAQMAIAIKKLSKALQIQPKPKAALSLK